MALRLVVTDIVQDYSLQCGADCAEKAGCPLLLLRRRLQPEDARMVRISLSVENSGPAPVTLSADGWELVDADGYSVGGALVCEALLPAHYVPLDRWEIAPYTCVRSMMAFPAGNAPPMLLMYNADDRRLRSGMLLKLHSGLRRERLNGKAKVKVSGRGAIGMRECWSYRTAEGRRRYIFTGTKK